MAITTDHAQLSLIPLEVAQATLTVGLVTSSGHLQVQLRVEDPSTRTLLALESIPHRAAELGEATLVAAAQRLWELLEEHTSPF